MAEVNCKKIVFSSSATVYEPVHSLAKLPLTETSATGATTNPYARSKLHVEEMLRDMSIADRDNGFCIFLSTSQNLAFIIL